MAITFACPQYGRQVRAPDEMAGKRGQCPRCGAFVAIPSKPPPMRINPRHPLAVASGIAAVLIAIAALYSSLSGGRSHQRPITSTDAVRQRYSARPPRGQRAPSFRTDDFGESIDWAQDARGTIGNLTGSGNEIAIQEYVGQLMQKLNSLVGQEVRWSVPVERVTEKYVELRTRFSGFCIAYLPGDRMAKQGDIQEILFASKLYVGMQIPRGEVLSLARGDAVAIRGRIYRASLYQGRGDVIVELNQVTSASFSDAQRADAATHPLPAEDGKDEYDRFFRKLGELITPE